MAIKDLVPKFGQGRERRVATRRESDPFREFQREMNRLFDDFLGGSGGLGGGLLPSAWARGHGMPEGGFSPRVNVDETDKAIRVTAELPGLDEKDVSVELGDASLTVRGERREEREDKTRGVVTRELSYGSFHRVIPLPADVDAAQAKATFRKGLLTVTVPKREDSASTRRRIAIESD